MKPKQKPKYKHNKKRNTAFLYEALVQELTKAVMENKTVEKNKLVLILKEAFSSPTQLGQELRLYRSLSERETGLAESDARRLVAEVRNQHEKNIFPEKLFVEQSRLIKKINTTVNSKVYSNFVPNYKDYATIAQLFNEKTTAKEKVLLENTIAAALIAVDEDSVAMEPIDNLTYKTFVNGFNETYESSLLEEQKEVLSRHIYSFSDGGLALKTYLNEEIGRLKSVVEKSMQIEEIKNDKLMRDNTKQVLNILEGLGERNVDKKYLSDILKIQQLAREVSG